MTDIFPGPEASAGCRTIGYALRPKSATYRLGNCKNEKSLATGQGFPEEQSNYGVVVVVALLLLLLSLEFEIATPTAITATAAATVPAVTPPLAASTAGGGVVVCANALPATNTDAIKTANALFIFLSCINCKEKPNLRGNATPLRLLSAEISILQA
jgi:hypothetical protein